MRSRASSTHVRWPQNRRGNAIDARSELVPGAWRVFQLAVEEEGGIGEFFPREAEGGAKEDLGRPLAR
jgi:hypothetical protein